MRCGQWNRIFAPNRPYTAATHCVANVSNNGSNNSTNITSDIIISNFANHTTPYFVTDLTNGSTVNNIPNFCGTYRLGFTVCASKRSSVRVCGGG